MALKIELKPNERVILGDCVVTNDGQRTRLSIEGNGSDPARKGHHDARAGPTARQSASISPSSSCTRRSVRRTITRSISGWCGELLKAAPSTRPFIDSINNQILTGELYKALKETRKLIAYERELLDMHYASKAYAKIAKETAAPRELEASLLLKAAAKLQAVHDSWHDKPAGLNDALAVQSPALDGVSSTR